MNRLTRYARNTALSLATIATLYGCGGGGGGSSPTQPPAGTTVSACVQDPRNGRAVSGSVAYKSTNGDKVTSLDGAGCFAVTDADPFSTFSINAPGYEQRQNVQRGEMTSAGNRVYVVSLEEPFYSHFSATRRKGVDGAEVGISGWPSRCRGDGLTSITLKYFNLTQQQINALSRNFGTFAEMTAGDYVLGIPTEAANAEFEPGVLKIVGTTSGGGTVFSPFPGKFTAVKILLPNTFFNAGWEGAYRHELGHAAGAIGHAGIGLMNPTTNLNTNTIPLDIDAAKVGACLPYGNKAAPASTTGAVTAAVEESTFGAIPSIPSFGLSGKTVDKLTRKDRDERRPAEAMPDVRPSRRLIGENRQ